MKQYQNYIFPLEERDRKPTKHMMGRAKRRALHVQSVVGAYERKRDLVNQGKGNHSLEGTPSK